MADHVDDQPVVAPATIAPAVVSVDTAPAALSSSASVPETAPAAAQADQPAVATAASDRPDAAASSPDGLGPTLLQEFDAGQEKPVVEAKLADPAAPKPAAPVAAEVKPATAADGAKPAEAPTLAAPVDVPKIDYFTPEVKIPEAIKISDAQRSELAGAFDLLRTPGKHSEGVNTLIGLHEKAMKDHDASVRKSQWDVFRETNKAWRDEVLADPYLGGSGHQTAMAAVARMRDKAVSSHKPGTPEYEADRKTFDNFLNSTGAGNHPAFLRMLHNFARYFDEPAMPPADIRVPKDNGRAPGDRRGRMYPSMNGGQR